MRFGTGSGDRDIHPRRLRDAALGVGCTTQRRSLTRFWLETTKPCLPYPVGLPKSERLLLAPLSISARFLPRRGRGLAQAPAAQAPSGFSFSFVRLSSAALCYLSPPLGLIPQRPSRPRAL